MGMSFERRRLCSGNKLCTGKRRFIDGDAGLEHVFFKLPNWVSWVRLSGRLGVDSHGVPCNIDTFNTPYGYRMDTPNSHGFAPIGMAYTEKPMSYTILRILRTFFMGGSASRVGCIEERAPCFMCGAW